MSRLRYDNALGTLGASLSSSGTTITFDADPGFSTLSGSDFIVLVLEPSTDGEPSAKFEIVYLTAFTATHTTGTITRGQEGTTGVSHANGVVWVCGPTAEDFTTASGLTSFQGRSTAAATLTKADVTGTGLAASDVGADASGAAATAQSNAEAASLPLAGGTMSGAIAMGSHKVTNLTNGSASSDAAAFGQIPVASTTTPVVNGTAAVGTGTTWAKADHVHPTDTSRAPTASPTLTGTVTVPNQTALDNSTKAANTAYADAAVAVEKTRALAAEALLTAPPPAGLPNWRRATSPYLRGQIAATRCGIPTTTNNASSAFTSRVPFTVPAGAAYADLELEFPNWFVTFSGEANMTLAATVQAAIEYNGVNYPLFFNGQATVSIPVGGAAITTISGIELPAGALYYVRSYYDPTSGGVYPQINTGGAPWNVTGSYQTGNHVSGTGALANVFDNTGNVYGPTAITGTPSARVPSVLVCGDSRSMGYNDLTNGQGYINTALGNSGFASMNIAVFGELGATFSGDGHQMRGRYIAGCDYATEAYGINDLDAATAITVANLQALRIANWNLLGLRGLKVFADTLQPETTSTNGWIDSTHQTHGLTTSQGETNRVAFNQWMRAGAPMKTGAAVAVGTSGAITAPVYTWNGSSFTAVAGSGSGHPLTGVFDSCALVESAVFHSGAGTDSGFWKAGTGSVAWTDDGVHLNSAGCAAAAPAIDTSLFV